MYVIFLTEIGTREGLWQIAADTSKKVLLLVSEKMRIVESGMYYIFWSRTPSMQSVWYRRDSEPSTETDILQCKEEKIAMLQRSKHGSIFEDRSVEI